MTSIVSVDDTGLTLAALLTGALALPLIGTIILASAGKHQERGPLRGHLTTWLAGVATLGLLGLLAYPDHELHLPVWLPSAGPVSLHLGGLGGQAAVATAMALLVGLLLSPPDTPAQGALLLATLSATNFSFLAGDFLTRYVALEILGLGIALAPLVEGLRHSVGRTKEVYLFLRLGDVGLLIAILVLMEAGGTLVIGDALTAGTRLSGAPLGWVVAGMLTAVWVKTAAWPFHVWQAVAGGVSLQTGAWLYGVAMPNLGLYLLYRIAPLLALDPIFTQLTLGLSSIGILATTGRLLGGRSWSQLPVHLNAVLGCVGLGMAATGHQDLLGWLLLIATPARLLVWLATRRLVNRVGRAPSIIRRTSLEDWLLRLAKAVSLIIEDRILQQGIVRLWRAVVGAAHLGHRVVERGEVTPWRAVVRTARLWYRVGGRAEVRHPLRVTVQSTLSISHWLQGRHTGRLRRNLQWVVLGLIAIATFVAVTGWQR